jgi:hypothetical protein
MENYFSVPFFILGIMKVAIMWLDYKECKKQKNTDKD